MSILLFDSAAPWPDATKERTQFSLNPAFLNQIYILFLCSRLSTVSIYVIIAISIIKEVIIMRKWFLWACDIIIGVLLVFGIQHFLKPYYDKQLRLYEEQAQLEAQQHVSKILSIIAGDETIIKSSQVKRPTHKEAYATISNEKRNFNKQVYFGDTPDILSLSIGQYEYSGIPGEGKAILLAGHNSTHFKELRNFKKGDHVKIDTAYGSFLYEVGESEIILADDFDVKLLDKQEEFLIMYCCYPFDSLSTDYRYFVYAKKIDGPKIEEDGSWKE